LGAALGSRLAKLFGNRLKIIGGMILIAIGLRVLLEHLVQ
jgi:putative Mn2+ efflux pump MntP